MPESFPVPSFTYNYTVSSQAETLRNYRDTEPGRAIPTKQDNKLLIATWNIANLGGQDRDPRDYRLLAEMISWFDIVGIQEVKDDLSGLRAIQNELDNYKAIFTDKAGNEERMAFLYDANKVELMEKFGEIAIPVADHRFIKLPSINNVEFKGFDRNPFLVSFKAGSESFVLINAHLYFGDDYVIDRNRRALEGYAVGRWAHLRSDDVHAYSPNIIALGDFNMPKVEPGDPIYDAMTRRGLRRPEHSTKIYSNISNDKEYDQIFFVPRVMSSLFTGKIGVFDFDSAIFSHIWETKTATQFRSFVRYHISDHRPGCGKPAHF